MASRPSSVSSSTTITASGANSASTSSNRPVSVGIFLKNPRKFAELRPMQRWVALSFSLRRPATHPTIVRKVIPYAGRYFHVANLAEPADLDERLRDLLTTAYAEAIA